MIGDNYTLIAISLTITIILLISLIYFINSLIKTIKNYRKTKIDFSKAESSSLKNNPFDPNNDDEKYYSTSKDSPNYIDPTEFLDKDKKEFISKIDNVFKEYNTEKNKYISNNFEGRDNDDIIDQRVLYDDHDNYSYKLN